MDFRHRPVLFRECLEGLDIKADGVYVDGTVGGAGHAKGITDLLNNQGTLIGIDRDGDAIEASRKRLADSKCDVRLVKGNYADIKDILSIPCEDRISLISA